MRPSAATISLLPLFFIVACQGAPSSGGGPSDATGGAGAGGAATGGTSTGGGTVADDASDYLFRTDQVLSFYLEIPPESYAAIDAEARSEHCPPPDRQYHQGALRLEQQVFENVGIRTKGGCGSLRDLSGKAAFKVNLEWDDPDVTGCPPERKLFGLSKLTFNNAVQDPSQANERLGYRLYRELGVPAPRVAHVRLYINGDYWGSYVHVETHSRAFLKRWFTSNDGMMYEGGIGTDLASEWIPEGDDRPEAPLEMEFKPGPCSKPRPDGDPLTYEPALDLIRRLDELNDDTFYPAVTEFMDFDKFLTMWAVDVAISNSDSYTYAPNNYRIYHDPTTGKWTVLPSGIDQTFAAGEAGEMDATFASEPWEVGPRLTRSCARNAACRAAARARMLEVIEHFERAGLEAEATAIEELIGLNIQEDPRREFSLDEFGAAYDSLREYIQSRPQAVRTLLGAAP